MVCCFSFLLFSFFVSASFAKPQMSDSASKQEECLVEDQNGIEKPCVFPFRADNNQTFFGCTQHADDPIGTLWCSTKTDAETHKHVQGQGEYGHCPQTCPKNEDFIDVNQEALKIEDEISEISNAISIRSQECPCVQLTQCSTFNSLVKTYLKLKSNRRTARHPTAFKIASVIRSFSCGSAGTQFVTCCSFKFEQTGATGNTDRQPSDATNDPNLGTWQPRHERQECGTKTIDPSPFKTFVVGGDVSERGEFPFMAILRYRVRGILKQACGGAIINKWYILTAAHCLFHPQRPGLGNPVEIIIGEHDTSSNEERIRIIKPASFKVHEDYTPRTVANDIGLIRLSQPIEFSKDTFGVQPVCLPWKQSDPGNRLPAGERKLTVTGWGRTENSTGSDILLKANLPLLSSADCKRIWKQTDSDIQFCAGGEDGIDSCSGDSGGPLVYQTASDQPYIQIGIVSYGTLRCGNGFPGVYSRITSFIPWIIGNLQP